MRKTTGPVDGLIERKQAEIVSVLNGDRGDPLDAALRRRELNEVRLLIGTIRKQADEIEAALNAADARLDSIEALATSLEEEIPDLVADVAALDARVDILEATGGGGGGGGSLVIDGNDIEGEGALLIFDLEAT